MTTALLALLPAALALPQNGDASPTGGGPNLLVMMGGLALIFWFVLIAPERKERKRKAAMLDNIKKNDKVIMTGGMFATVAAVNENDLTVKFDEGPTRVRVLKSAIASVIEPKGEAKS